MTKLFQNPDGANYQARAVLAYLSARAGVERSWDEKANKYLAEPEVNRWYNNREQGYVVSMRDCNGSRQINIVFYEHRNTDEICAIAFEGVYINPPTVDTLPRGVFKDKYDYTHSVGYGKPAEMADWIMMRLEDFWAWEGI